MRQISRSIVLVLLLLFILVTGCAPIQERPALGSQDVTVPRNYISELERRLAELENQALQRQAGSMLPPQTFGEAAQNTISLGPQLLVCPIPMSVIPDPSSEELEVYRQIVAHLELVHKKYQHGGAERLQQIVALQPLERLEARAGTVSFASGSEWDRLYVQTKPLLPKALVSQIDGYVKQGIKTPATVASERLKGEVAILQDELPGALQRLNELMATLSEQDQADLKAYTQALSALMGGFGAQGDIALGDGIAGNRILAEQMRGSAIAPALVANYWYHWANHEVSYQRTRDAYTSNIPGRSASSVQAALQLIPPPATSNANATLNQARSCRFQTEAMYSPSLKAVFEGLLK